MARKFPQNCRLTSKPFLSKISVLITSSFFIYFDKACPYPECATVEKIGN